MKIVKKMAILASPLLLFIVLFLPYAWLNQAYIVDWLGCGCPVIDDFGNIVENNFNANDFTALFWLFVSLCTTAASAFLSGRIPKKWVRVLYVAGMLLVSLWIADQFRLILAWS